jgi:hypothetical protein
VVMRRQIDELARSSEGLRQALGVIEARRDMAARSPAAPAIVTAGDRAGLAERDGVAGADDELEARKRRLAGPG